MLHDLNDAITEQLNLDYLDLDYPKLFLWSQFCPEYLFIMIKICSHILFKTTVLKSEAKASLFHFQKLKVALACIVTNEDEGGLIGLELLFC